MFDSLILNILHPTAMLSAAMLAGIYGIFSNTLMPALATSPDQAAARVMQDINRVILNPVFLGLFIGSALSGLAILILAGLTGQLTITVAAASVMLSVTCLTTATVNVPLNDQLGDTALDNLELSSLWHYYLDRWVRWNHIRGVLCALSAVLYAVAGFNVAG